VNEKVVKLLGTFQNIDKSKRVENALKNSQHKLVAQRRIATAFLTTKGDEVYAEVLKIVLEYLQSKYGFFGYINGQGDLVSPSLTRDIWSECQVEDKSIVFPRAQWSGLWGDSLKQKKSLHSNESLSPPQGHVPLFCALAVPILYHEELIGQIVVANKEDGYSEEDINQLEAIAKHISPILNARLEAVKSEKGRLIAEKALQESEERYREFVEGTDNLITQVDAEGKFTFVNYVAQDIYEMDPSDCIGKSAFDFIHPDDRQRTEETFREWLRTQTKHATFENRQISKLGIVRNLLWSIHLKYDNNDNLLYINSIAQNITDLRKAEEALRQAKEELEIRVFERTVELNTINEELTQEIQERIETELRLRNSEKRYRELYEGSRDGIAFTDLEGKITRFNNSFREILGYSEEELYALSYRDLTPERWHEMESNFLHNEVLRYGYSPLYEKEYISKEGSIITVEIRTYMLRDENYKHIGFWAFVRDITDRKQAEEQLRFQEERLKLALEATSDGLWDWHVQKEEVYFSPRYYTMLGYEPYELPSTFDTWLNLLHPEDKDKSVKKIEHHLKSTRDELELEFRLKTKKSRWRWIFARGKVVERDEQQRPIRMIGTHEDITSRKKTENALKERVGLLELAREIGLALTKKESLDNTLQLCCESIVKHLDFLFTRIWLIDERQAILILRASAGLYTHLNGEHSRIPLGQLKIGRIGEQNESMVINDLQEKGTIIDLEWAARENIQAFAGYPITISDKVVGVIAMFSQKPISPMIHNSLESITNHIAIGIQRFIADDALRSSEEKYRLVSENIPVVVYSALPDEGSTSTFISGQIKELTGYTETEFLNDPEFFSKILHEDDRDFVWEHIQKHRQNKDPLNLQYRMVTKSGELKWIRDKATVLLDERGNIIQINGFMEDITDHKLAEKALVTKSRELEEVFEAIPDAVVYADTERRIIKVNPGFTYLFGYKPEDVLGQKTQILYADTEQFHNQGKQRYNPEAKGNMDPFEMNYKKKNGDIFISETVGTPVRDTQDRPIGYLGIIRDISERKQKENEIHRLNEELEHRVHERTAQLQAANKELEAFSYSISHDLRAPLRAIDGFSRALQEDFSEQLNDEGQMYIERVRRNAQRMAGLIDDILKLSRMARAEIKAERLNLSELAESILQEWQDADPKRVLEWSVAPNITAKGDERMIRLVLENLLGNAWKFTSKHSSPRIEFGTMKEQGK
ncbi:PAS domain S-box protein, partial [bacterium]|nr:PAS domain S-box protein [bacterium]